MLHLLHLQFIILQILDVNWLNVSQSVMLLRVVPVLDVPDALVPLDVPVTQISLLPGETTAIWVSIDVPLAQPPGLYQGEFIITAIKEDAESLAHCLGKAEKHQLYKELRNYLDTVETVERVKSASTSLRRVLLSPSFSELFSDNAAMMDEDVVSNLKIRLKLNLTVWDFILPATPSLPAVFGRSDTVIEDCFGVEHGTEEWYKALDMHFKWLLQYQISPYFCACPCPGSFVEEVMGDVIKLFSCHVLADHPKLDEYLSNSRLATYAVPYQRVVSGYMIVMMHQRITCRKKLRS